MSQQTLLVLGVILVLVGYMLWAKYYQKPKPKAELLTTDLTELARLGKLNKVIGMDQTLDRIFHILARKQKNSPLLLGEPGVGKTAVIEALAQKIFDKTAPESFLDKRVLTLDLGSLISGTKFRGELEGRLSQFMRSLEEKPREAIIFIDEIHMIGQAKGSEGGLDLADMLKPALARGDILIIGATTWKEYEQYIRVDEALDRRFQPVIIEEPSAETTVTILSGIKDSYEKFHGVCITPEALQHAVTRSGELMKDRYFPDKAFDLIDEASAKVSLEAADPRHMASIGLIHEASKQVKQNCSEGSPSVTAEDVEEVAKQWKSYPSKQPKN